MSLCSIDSMDEIKYFLSENSFLPVDVDEPNFWENLKTAVRAIDSKCMEKYNLLHNHFVFHSSFLALHDNVNGKRYDLGDWKSYKRFVLDNRSILIGLCNARRSKDLPKAFFNTILKRSKIERTTMQRPAKCKFNAMLRSLMRQSQEKLKLILQAFIDHLHTKIYFPHPPSLT